MKASLTKSAIVTGASGGIGRVVAKRLASDGFTITVHYAGNPAKAEGVVAEINSGGGRAIAVQADVAKPADVERLFKQTLEAFGTIDVVVHSAGIMPLLPIAGGDVETFDKVITTNLRGTFVVLAQAAQHVSSGGRFIAFKAGVEGLVRVLANELRGRNITVNAVAPGQVETDLFLKGKSDARIDELKKMNPLERLGQPEDMANLVSFLAGPDGGWINAQVLRANGGFV